MLPIAHENNSDCKSWFTLQQGQQLHLQCSAVIGIMVCLEVSSTLWVLFQQPVRNTTSDQPAHYTYIKVLRKPSPPSQWQKLEQFFPLQREMRASACVLICCFVVEGESVGWGRAQLPVLELSPTTEPCWVTLFQSVFEIHVYAPIDLFFHLFLYFSVYTRCSDKAQ